MNRKGFAITTVVYGLTVLGLMIMSILMGLLSSTRNNVASEAERVEKELIAFNMASQSYTCNGTYYTYTVPEGESGWYRIEAFGKSSGTLRGGYTTGIIYLKEKTSLEICEGTSARVKVGSRTIMYAANGTLKGYSKESVGPKFDSMMFKLNSGENITGSIGVSYGVGSNSIIAGYPGSYSSFSGKYFVDGLMIPTVNLGAGKITIQKLAPDEENDESSQASRIPGRNGKYNNVTSITVRWRSSSVSVRSIYVSSNGTIINKTCSSNPCTFTFSNRNIDDVSIFFTDSSYNKHIGGNTSSSYVTVDFTAGGASKQVYNNSTTSAIMNVTPTGIKLSAYQPDYLDTKLPNHGNYYIFPVTTESRAMSARESSEGDSNPIIAEYFGGETRQKWSIDMITNQDNTVKLFDNIINKSGEPEYRIMELTRYKSIAIYQDENIRRNVIAAPETFQSLSRNNPQIWNIKELNDGTYAIKTVVEPSNPLARSGFLAADTNADGSESNPIRIMIGTVNNTTQSTYKLVHPTEIERFKLYSIDFITS